MSTRLPIRWRLTIWYAAFLAGSMILLGAGFYLGTRTLLVRLLRGATQKQSALAQSSVHTDGNHPDHRSQYGRQPAGRRAFRPPDKHTDGSTVVDTSASVGSVTIDPNLAGDALNGGSSVSSAETPEGTILIKTTPVRSGFGDRRCAAGRRIPWRYRGCAAVLMIGPGSPPRSSLISAGGGYMLAGRALAPVAAITNLAAEHWAEDLRAPARPRFARR